MGESFLGLRSVDCTFVSDSNKAQANSSVDRVIKSKVDPQLTRVPKYLIPLARNNTAATRDIGAFRRRLQRAHRLGK